MMQSVSVIIPAYNVEAYLDRCMLSVVNQSYTRLEIIIVNDGSTDTTGILCERWKEQDNRIKVITQRNQGLSAARNRGIEEAQGAFLFFVDSDDWLETDAVSKMMEIQKLANADIVCCGIYWTYEDGHKELFTIKGQNRMTGKEAIKEMIKNRTVCSVAWNKLYKRELWKEYRYPSGKLHEDEFTTYKLLYEADKVYYMDEPLYNYYQRNSGIMGQLHEKGSLIKIEALGERTDWLDSKGEEDLADISILETLNYLKYIYRTNQDRALPDEKLAVHSWRLYKEYACKAVKRKGISIKDKTKILFWRVALPRQYRRKGHV